MIRFTPPRRLPRGTPTTTTLRITTPSRHLPRISRPYSSNPPSQHGRPLLTLAIETSCDDTCVAVLEKSGPAARLLFDKKVTSDHRAFGGVHPAVAVIGHDAALATLVQEAIQHLPAATSPSPTSIPTPTPRRRAPDFVTATRGPGMSANLSVGLNTAKGLACAWGVPLLGVHHMQAHALTPRLVSALSHPWPPSSHPSPIPSYTPSFPFLTLLISGGHTLLLHSLSLTTHRLLATTPSHAIGNMLDASARLILPPSYTASSPTTMYAAALEAFTFPPATTPPDYNYTPPARRADEILPYHSTITPGLWHLTPPLRESRAMAFNFTGLGSQIPPALAKIVSASRSPDEELTHRRELALALQTVAFQQLTSRIVFALDSLNPHPSSSAYRTNPDAGVKTLVISGGVASNKFLRHVVRRVLEVRGHGGVEVVVPPGELCTDNAAMVGWAGVEMWEAGWRSGMDVLVRKRWGVDDEQEGGDGGVLGVGGWWNVNDGKREGEGEGGGV